MNRELVAATAAAYTAGEILCAGFGQTHEIQHKGAIDIVTEVDRTAEAKIVDLLRSVFPGYGFLTEESGTIPGETDERWIIDPLHGEMLAHLRIRHVVHPLAEKRPQIEFK